MATLVRTTNGDWANLDSLDTIFEKEDGMLSGIETANPSVKSDLPITAHNLHLALADFVPVTGYWLAIADIKNPNFGLIQILGLYVNRGIGGYVAALAAEGGIVPIPSPDRTYEQYALRLPLGGYVSAWGTLTLFEWLDWVGLMDSTEREIALMDEGAIQRTYFKEGERLGDDMKWARDDWDRQCKEASKSIEKLYEAEQGFHWDDAEHQGSADEMGTRKTPKVNKTKGDK